ncbi:hypothetical protein, partial [Alistipes putredinis]|uniref:hypothetical protein n=1 Tax=Alistipes putredinis TaxID=28117 RepID=UPI003AF57A1B
IPFPSCEWIGCFSNFEMICFVSSVIENKISDCPERPDSKSRIAAAGDKDKAKTLACRQQRLSCWTGRRKKIYGDQY